MHGTYSQKTLRIQIYGYSDYYLFLVVEVFYAISSITDNVLSINPSADVFVFGDFAILHMGWSIYSGETVRPGELYYNFI